MNMRAEMGVMLLYAKEHQRWPAIPRSQERDMGQTPLAASGISTLMLDF